MMLLRFVSILIAGVWLTRSILFPMDKPEARKTYYSIFGLQWEKIGMEIPMIFWLILNTISSIFSRNIYVSIIGAYDRWEGILLVINYAFLVYMFAKLVDNERFFNWMFLSFIVSSSMSAFYGVIQKLGFDFMNWSADPTGRVFGSINNPVHYGPYVGMMVPMALAWMLYLGHKREREVTHEWKTTATYWVAMILSILIYYAMYLSWGRGTWMGFQGGMTLFLLFSMRLFIEKNRKLFFIDVLLTLGFIAVWYFNSVFVLYKLGLKVILPSLLMAAIYFAYIWSQRESTAGAIKSIVQRILVIYLFQILQFISIDYKPFVTYIAILAILVVLGRKENNILKRSTLLPVLLSILAIIIFIPLIPIVPDQIKDDLVKLHVIKVKVKSDDVLLAGSKYTAGAKGKIDSYQKEAVTGKSARISMWKTGIKWGRANLLLGTGPDTIKEIYPYYRRADYGRLEGGHNLTPDRLHNEYVNTFATTGLSGVILRYGIVLGSFFILIVGYLYNNRNNASYYLLLGSLGGVLFYQGQVLFNFGVVATASLNYMLMGLGLAIGHYRLGNAESTPVVAITETDELPQKGKKKKNMNNIAGQK